MPADKNDEGIDDPISHLSCYEIVDGDPGPTVIATHQFGSHKLDLGVPKELSVPTEKLLTPGPESPARDQAIQAPHVGTKQGKAVGPPALLLVKPVRSLNEPFRRRFKRPDPQELTISQARRTIGEAELKSLQDVALDDALRLRKDGLLHGMRSFMGKVWRTTASDEPFAESNGRSFARRYPAGFILGSK